MLQISKSLSGRRILLVEDEFMIAEIMEEWLNLAGAVVVGPVPTATQALRLIQTEREALDGAVLDINLGDGQTAYPVADTLSVLGVPYMFATGDVQIADAPAYRGRPRLEKPVLGRELLRAVEELVKGRPALHS